MVILSIHACGLQRRPRCRRCTRPSSAIEAVEAIPVRTSPARHKRSAVVEGAGAVPLRAERLPPGSISVSCLAVDNFLIGAGARTANTCP